MFFTSGHSIGQISDWTNSLIFFRLPPKFLTVSGAAMLISSRAGSDLGHISRLVRGLKEYPQVRKTGVDAVHEKLHTEGLHHEEM